MRSKSKGGGTNLLLLAGLGVGAFMLFGNKSSASSDASSATSADTGSEGDIPAAPKFVAVNTSSTESPLPTGIVSDEEGMESTTPQSYTSSSSGSNDWEDTSDSPGAMTTKAASVPALVSTQLTAKEKTIIQKGVLTNDLAVKRPDLYKAIYVKKYGQQGKGSQALKAAEAAIQKIQVSSAPKSTATQKKKRKIAIRLNPKLAAKQKTLPKKAVSKHPVRAAGKKAAPAGHRPTIKPHPVRPTSSGQRPVSHSKQRKPVAKKQTVRRTH